MKKAEQRQRSSLVQGRHHLRAARPRLRRLQQRRHRRLPGPDLRARLSAGSRRHLHLAPAVLPVAAARRRLRHRQLRRRQSRATARSRTSSSSSMPPIERGMQVHDRAGHQPHLRPASLVPGGAACSSRLARARVLRLDRHRPAVQRRPHHLHRHRKIELDVGPGREGLLLASILLPPARPQLR